MVNDLMDLMLISPWYDIFSKSVGPEKTKDVGFTSNDDVWFFCIDDADHGVSHAILSSLMSVSSTTGIDGSIDGNCF